MRRFTFRPDESQLSAQGRRRIYFLVAAVFFCACLAMASIKAIVLHQKLDLVLSDGRFYYAYLPSVLMDGDLDFTNQIQEHWGPDFKSTLLEERTQTGLVNNKYPIGLALTLAPAFLLGHLIALASGNSIPADGYSWPYQLIALAMIEMLAWRMLMQVDRIGTERLNISAKATLIGLLVLAFGTHYSFYACREPFMVHAVSAFWCTEVVAAVAWARKPTSFWPRLGFAWAMAIVCRPTNVHLVFVAACGVANVIRAASWKKTLRATPLAAVGAIPIGLQLVTWHELTGHWIAYSYGNERFDWTHPLLWETLFSSRHGLFYWSPVLLFAVLALMRRLRDPLVFCWSLGGLLLWYANSAWWCWWFGDAFGGRSFLELAGLFGIGFALLFEKLRRYPKATMAFFLFAVVYNAILMALYISHRIPRDGSLLP